MQLAFPDGTRVEVDRPGLHKFTKSFARSRKQVWRDLTKEEQLQATAELARTWMLLTAVNGALSSDDLSRPDRKRPWREVIAIYWSKAEEAAAYSSDPGRYDPRRWSEILHPRRTRISIALLLDGISGAARDPIRLVSVQEQSRLIGRCVVGGDAVDPPTHLIAAGEKFCPCLHSKWPENMERHDLAHPTVRLGEMRRSLHRSCEHRREADE